MRVVTAAETTQFNEFWLILVTAKKSGSGDIRIFGRTPHFPSLPPLVANLDFLPHS